MSFSAGQFSTAVEIAWLFYHLFPAYSELFPILCPQE